MGFLEDNFSIACSRHTDSQRIQALDSIAASSDQVCAGDNSGSPRHHTEEVSPVTPVPSLSNSSQGGASERSSPHELHSVKPPSIRQRTAQACDKCRERKTKCSGHHPICLRCTNRGLTCEYKIRETRVRTPLRTRTIALSNPFQVNYGSSGRPTPAYRSRMGNYQIHAYDRSSSAHATSTPSFRRQITPSYSAAPVFDRLGYDGRCDLVMPRQDFDAHYSVAEPRAHSAKTGDLQVKFRCNPSLSPSHSLFSLYSDPPGSSENSLCHVGPRTSSLDDTELLYACDYTTRNMMAAQTSIPPVHVNEAEEHTVLHETPMSMSIPESWYHLFSSDEPAVSTSHSQHFQDPPSSSSPIPQGQNIHRHPMEAAMSFSIAPYGSSDGYCDQSFATTVPSRLQDMSFLALEYGSMDTFDPPCSPYDDNSISSASTPSLGLNPSGSSSEGDSTSQMELMCPTPSMPIGPGAYDIHVPLAEKIYDSHDGFHHPGLYGMLIHAPIPEHFYSAPPFSDSDNRLEEYGFFK